MNRIKTNLILLVCMALLFFVPVMAQEDKKEENIPPGMEIVLIGKTKFLVPEGTQFRKEGDLLILENVAEYTGRRLKELEDRLVKIEEKISEFSDEVERLNQAMAGPKEGRSAAGEEKE